MIFEIFLLVFSISFLIFLHELGHFLFAKYFKVKVEEFGIGLPPRIFSKKIGNTIFSLNFLPFGGFVKLFGEKEIKKEPGSFSALPVSKRFLIVLGGAISFWIFATILAIFLLNIGLPIAISDEENVASSKVIITQVSENSPAKISDLREGDIILEIEGEKTEKVKKVREIIDKNLGKEVLVKIQRGKTILEKKVFVRENPPNGEGPIGISILRVSEKKYSFFEALKEGPIYVLKTNSLILNGYYNFFKDLVLEKKTKATLVGPVGISFLAWQSLGTGWSYFVNFLILLSLNLAFLNLLPIPALDGGKILFLAIEGVRKKPISQELENKISALFFLALILILILVTIEDIRRFF